MNSRRRLLVALGAGALTLRLRALAQTQGKVWRVGYLDLGSRQLLVDSGRYAALMEGLGGHGYVEGRNLVIEARFADGNTDRLDGFAAELVRQQVDLILTQGTPASHAAKRATAAIPIVVTQATDPVGEGFAASLARPGANLTGMTSGIDDTAQKLVELLMAAVPTLKRIAVLSNPANVAHRSMLSNLQLAAQQTGKQLLPLSVRTPAEIEPSFATMARERIDGVIILGDTLLFSLRTRISGLALKQRLPSIYTNTGYAEAGGLMNYGADFNDNFRRAGIFVDKILKGTKPGDIPFEQPTRYYLVINGKSAKALGVKLTGELLTRADKVIE
jgi:putative ABC transport system substrate-binding protein